MIAQDCTVSFVIPTLNEEEHIGGVLDAVRKHAGVMPSYEVIVIDNGSRDRTVEIAIERGASCLHAPGCTISVLRNLGASRAVADILIFLDADVYLKPEWADNIGEVIIKLHHNPNIITGSLYGIGEENNWIERIWFAPRASRTEAGYINGGHLIIHRSLFSQVGGFAPELETGEDHEFCLRAKESGAKIDNDPRLRVVHAGYPKTIRRFFARERWHGRGDGLTLNRIRTSKPALTALVNIIAALLCLFGIVSPTLPWWMWCVIYLLFFIALSSAAALQRCGLRPLSVLPSVIFLYMIYITARSMSLIDVFIHSLLKNRRNHEEKSAA